MNKKQLLETAEIKAGNWEDNLTPFKPRPRFGSGHFAFAVVLTFTFFTFPSTVYTATIVTKSQSLESGTKPGNQSNIKIEEPSTKAIGDSLKDIKDITTQLEKRETAIREINENKTA